MPPQVYVALPISTGKPLSNPEQRSQLSPTPENSSQTFDPILVPRPQNTAIRDHLAKWQDLYGAPTEETLTAFQNYYDRDNFQNALSKLSSSNKSDEDVTASERNALEEDENDDLITIGLFLRPGDVVELSQPGREPVLAVFVQQLDNDSQFFSVNGRWTHLTLRKISFAIQGCIDPALVQPLVPFLPTDPTKANPKGELHVPRDLASPVIAALEEMTGEAERIYRMNAPILDTAYTVLADGKRTRMMTLTQIAKKLLAPNDPAWKPSSAALLAVRKALNHNEYRFRSDSRSHRLTNVFAIRPKTDVQIVETVHEWIREYREYLALTVDKPRNTVQPSTKGAIYIQEFLEKARRLIKTSRKHRAPEYGGVGPSTAPKEAQSANKIKWGESFTSSDQQIINFLQAWALTDQFSGMAGLHAACVGLISATECYKPGLVRDEGTTDESLNNIRRATGLLFLQEIGVISPHENRALYDEQLMLPTVRLSRNLELLNTKAELTRRNPDFRDSMASLRRDWGSTTVYCIDDVGAKEIDDGISIERVKNSDNEFWIHVHVANPTAFFDKSHTLSGLAAHSTETVYTPERSYPMLPTWATQGHFSLDRDRPAMTFSSRINNAGSVLETKIQHSIIRNIVSITPSELATILGDNSVPSRKHFIVGGKVPKGEERSPPKLSPSQMEELRDLYTAAQALWEVRKAAGGIRFSPNNLSVQVYESPTESGLTWQAPSIGRARFIHTDPIIEFTNITPKELMPANIGPRNIVEEMMMLAGQTAAQWCAQRNIPVMYRGTVDPPSHEELSAVELRRLVDAHYEKHGKTPEHLATRFIRALGRAIAHSSPLAHKIIGVPGYVKVTSPLRRFSDMIAHWQIEAAVRYEAQTGKQFNAANGIASSRVLPFSPQQLQESIVTLTPRERIITTAKRDSTLFWASLAFLRAFKYKEAPLPDVFRFQVRQVREGRDSLGYLGEYGFVATMLQYEDVRDGDEWEVCDRTKPCSACCVRGLPRECHFVAEDGNYAPIQQSYELRRLRAENLQLKQRFHALGIPIHDDQPDPAIPLDSNPGSRFGPAWKRRASKHTGFQEPGWQDSIYFGTPGLATFAAVSIKSSETLTHIIPRSIDIFTPEVAPAYAFATIFSASSDECIPQLLSCLPTKSDIQDYLDAFGHRVSIDMGVEVSREQVERFLSDARGNSQSCPSMLALLFAILALGAQQSVWNKNTGYDTAKKEAEAQKGNVYTMQALRLDSFLHKPSLTAIQTLILTGKYLSDTGRFLDAFALFGTTIRLAHSIGLHCHPESLKLPPPTQIEVVTRQKIWWHMLRIDEEYAMMFGRPLGISSIGTCCLPQELTTDMNILRFREFMVRFTVLARQILGCGRLMDARIDEFTDAMRALLDTVPETLQFDEARKGEGNAASQELWSLRVMAAVYHCKAHTYLILLNRQRTRDEIPLDSHISRKASFPQTLNRSSPSNSPPTPSTQPCLRGCAVVLNSSQSILSIFSFFHQTSPSILIDWSLTQQAFNSSMLLLFDAIEHHSITPGAFLAEQSLKIFCALESNTAHKLAHYAVAKISRCLHTLHAIVAQSPHRRHEQQLPYCTDLEGIRQNGTMAHDLAGVESVMGNTGMQLLGDCGLQVEAQEAFAPISWGAPGLAGELEKRG
ncbi:mitochondrial protein cyt-4 [Curvularia clavata]|uniref:Mitochondrial protein cyt-4 n=1 Tax=Curvularia clavata TaxID=95742 RepID=A0A9Q8Z580_CURCL|nr:mitochondrial protein cyt-4 [Curvularia clavata]